MLWTADSIEITADQVCWTADGYNGCIIVEPPVIPPGGGGGGGRGSGPTNGIRKEGGYRPNYQDVLDDIRMEKIKREDIEIIEFIKVILTKGLL